MNIEKNIPIKKKKGITSTLRELGIGDSFILPKDKSRQGLQAQGNQIGIKVLTRKQDDGTIRVWRTE